MVMKSHAVLLGLIVFLSVVGIADSLYLAESAVTKTPLVCDIEGLNDCNVVAQSPYAKLFGIPLGIYGIGFYVVMLILALLVRYTPQSLWRSALFIWALVGALASLCFVYIQLVLIQAVCVYCLVSALISFLLVPLSWLFLKRFTATPPVVP